MSFSSRVRRLSAAVPWRQIVTVLAGVAVIVAMVVIAETEQNDQARHQRVQVLVERVRADGEELGEFAWQGLAETSYGGHEHKINAIQYLAQGFAIWNHLTTSVNELRAADHSAMTLALLRDANGLYAAGISLMPKINHTPNVARAMHEAQTVFTPVLSALDRDAVAGAALQQGVASQAASRAAVANIGSMVIGVLLLTLLGLRLYRIRRRTLLEQERRSIERRTEERVRALVEHSSDVITVVGADLTVRWQSTSLHRTLGHPVGGVLGRPLSDLVHPDDAQLLESQLAAATAKPGTVTFTARFLHATGGWRHLEAIAENRLGDPAIGGLVLSMRDISDRKALEDELRHQAFHDALTGLANRALFEDRLAHALAAARRQNRPVAVLFLDLDDFKTINDSLGHATGDDLLRAVARRIDGVVRVTDTAARLGGDEFGVLLEIMDDDQDGERIGGRLLEELAPPFALDDRELHVTASIGVALSDGAVGLEELLRNADTAMYAAKAGGKGAIETFEEGMHQRVLERLELTGEMQRALERGEFELDYQPIVELECGEVVGCEALVRWAHPDRGRLGPVQFIPLAEETGLIVALGDWILATACAQAAGWAHDFPNRELYMTVNVSTLQLQHPSFPDTVARALHDSGLAPGRLVLEITESMLPDDSGEIITVLHGLKGLGVRVAVDDFGTGYSALSRLQTYPVDILKIDRSFIDGIESDSDRFQLVTGIVTLGESLHLSVVAEGIEHQEQAEQLRRLRSPLGQGFLFSKPVSPVRLAELITSGASVHEAEGAPHAGLAVTEDTAAASG